MESWRIGLWTLDKGIIMHPDENMQESPSHFLEQVTLKFGEKRSLAIPKHFLAALPEEITDNILVLAPYRRDVLVYTKSGWEKLLDKLLSGEEDSFLLSLQPVGHLIRYLVGGAEEVPVDDAGVVAMPQELYEFVGLGREVTLVMMQSHIRIIHPEDLPALLEKVQS